MKNKIAITVLGNRNSGKSTTWNTLFGETVRTGIHLRHLYLTETEYIEVFLVSGSPEEREIYVGEIVGEQRPSVILCSIQYREDVTQTINFFRDNDYSIYTQWLNPGYHDGALQADVLGLISYLLYRDVMVSIRDGRIAPEPRVQEIRDFLYGWAKSRGLLRQ